MFKGYSDHVSTVLYHKDTSYSGHLTDTSATYCSCVQLLFLDRLASSSSNARTLIEYVASVTTHPSYGCGIYRCVITHRVVAAGIHQMGVMDVFERGLPKPSGYTGILVNMVSGRRLVLPRFRFSPE